MSSRPVSWRNLLGLTDPADVKVAEAQAVLIRRIDAIRYLNTPKRFTFETWKRLHGILFQDLYDWAGEPRTINMGARARSCSTRRPRSRRRHRRYWNA